MDFYQESKCIQKSLMVLAKFGYLRREFFWNYLSANSRSCKFRSWKLLHKTGYLEAYKRSFIGEDVFKLSKRGKRILANAGIQPVSAAHPLHFEHDDNVAHFALAAAQKGLIDSNWLSEKVLRQSSPQDVTQVFGSDLYKLPDLVFDIPLQGQHLRVAFEIERTRKSQMRYDGLVNAYAKTSGIHLVLIAFNDRSVFELIRVAARRLHYPQESRPIAFCKISELHNNWTNFPMRIGDQTLRFEQYIENLKRILQTPQKSRSDIESEKESLFARRVE
ncbi:MAG: hypothetical protein ACXVCD_18800 [Pseudobdellovibrionaceae bacterium]